MYCTYLNAKARREHKQNVLAVVQYHGGRRQQIAHAFQQRQAHETQPNLPHGRRVVDAYEVTTIHNFNLLHCFFLGRIRVRRLTDIRIQKRPQTAPLHIARQPEHIRVHLLQHMPGQSFAATVRTDAAVLRRRRPATALVEQELAHHGDGEQHQNGNGHTVAGREDSRPAVHQGPGAAPVQHGEGPHHQHSDQRVNGVQQPLAGGRRRHARISSIAVRHQFHGVADADVVRVWPALCCVYYLGIVVLIVQQASQLGYQDFEQKHAVLFRWSASKRTWLSLNCSRE